MSAFHPIRTLDAKVRFPPLPDSPLRPKADSSLVDGVVSSRFLINCGQSLYTVSRVLGHSDLRSTERYAHLSSCELLSAVEAGAAKMNGMTN